MNDFDQAAIADGNAVDIRGKILESRLSVADGQAMDHPILRPDFIGDLRKEWRFSQDTLETGAEEFGEGFDGQKKIGARGKPIIAIQASAGDQIVNMGMIKQVACPSVKNTNHPDHSAHIAWVIRQFLCGIGGGLE